MSTATALPPFGFFFFSAICATAALVWKSRQGNSDGQEEKKGHTKEFKFFQKVSFLYIDGTARRDLNAFKLQPIQVSFY